MTHPTPTWVERFRKEFADTNRLNILYEYTETDDVLSFIRTLLASQKKEIRELVAKDRIMFLKNNIVDLINNEFAIKVRKQLRKEILADIDALQETEDV